MARKGCDFSMARPSVNVLRGAGLEFVLRYVSTPGAAKNITRVEADRYKAAGIDIGIVFETTAGRALAGNAAGRTDWLRAVPQVEVAGGPAGGGVIYFAVDVDTTTTAERDAVVAYLGGVALAARGWDRVGVYGEYEVVEYVADHTPCRRFWQTYAWSGRPTRWHPRAQLRQVRNGVRLADGSEVDLCEAWADDWGQWPRTGATGMAMDADVTAAFKAVNDRLDKLGERVDDAAQYVMMGRGDAPAHVGTKDVYSAVRNIEEKLAVLDGTQPDGNALDIAVRLARIENRLNNLTLRAAPPT